MVIHIFSIPKYPIGFVITNYYGKIIIIIIELTDL